MLNGFADATLQLLDQLQDLLSWVVHGCLHKATAELAVERKGLDSSLQTGKGLGSSLATRLDLLHQALAEGIGN